MEQFIVKDSNGLSHQYTEEQHYSLRQKGYSTFAELTNSEGKKVVIIPPGLGILTSGDAMIDTKTYNANIKTLRNLEKYIEDNVVELISKIGVKEPTSLSLKLVWDNELWKVIEHNRGKTLLSLNTSLR